MTHTFLKTALLSTAIFTCQLSGTPASSAAAPNVDAATIAKRTISLTPREVIDGIKHNNPAVSASFIITNADLARLETDEGKAAIQAFIDAYNQEAKAHNYDLSWSWKNPKFSGFNSSDANGPYNFQVIGYEAVKELK